MRTHTSIGPGACGHSVRGRQGHWGFPISQIFPCRPCKQLHRKLQVTAEVAETTELIAVQLAALAVASALITVPELVGDFRVCPPPPRARAETSLVPQQCAPALDKCCT